MLIRVVLRTHMRRMNTFVVIQNKTHLVVSCRIGWSAHVSFMERPSHKMSTFTYSWKNCSHSSLSKMKVRPHTAVTMCVVSWWNISWQMDRSWWSSLLDTRFPGITPADYVYRLSENDIANSWKDNRGCRKCAEKTIDPHVGRACLSALCGQDH